MSYECAIWRWEIRINHRSVSVAKPFGKFGGVGYVKAVAQRLVNDRRVVFDRGAYGADVRSGPGGNTADAHDSGEDGGGAEASGPPYWHGRRLGWLGLIFSAG